MAARPKTQVLVVAPPQMAALRRLEAIRGMAEVTVAGDLAAVAAATPRAEVILFSSLAGDTPPMAEVWRHAGPILRWVHIFEAGVDKTLTPELIASPVMVSNGRGAYAEALAEFAAFAVLYFCKQGPRLIEQQRARKWEKFEVDSPAGQVMAVIGFGATGQACARAARKLGMRIHAMSHRRALAPAGVERMFLAQEMPAMLAGADVVVTATPLTPATRHLLGKAAFAAMKPGSVFINVGRGPVVDEAALIEGLRAGHPGAAALDVFEQEPLPSDSPLWSMENVLVSPHCTDRARQPHWAELGMDCFVANFRRYRRGLPLLTPVDKTAGY